MSSVSTRAIAVVAVTVIAACAVLLVAPGSGVGNAESATPTGTSGEESDMSAIDRALFTLTAEDYTTFSHPMYNFTFPYPKSFDVDITMDVTGQLISFEHRDFDLGFQIYMSRYYAVASMETIEHIRDEIAEEGIENVVMFYINDVVPAMRYTRTDAGLGPVHEAMFVANAVLYQLTLWGEPEAEWMGPWIRGLMHHDWQFIFEE